MHIHQMPVKTLTITPKPKKQSPMKKQPRPINIANLLRTIILPVWLLGSICSAQTNNSETTSYLDHPGAKSFIDEMVKQEGLDRHKVEQLLKSAHRQPKILEAIARPAEKTLTWAKYRNIFMTEDRIQKGIEFFQQYKEPLLKAEKAYGVPVEIITAILGVETRYGQHRGRYRVIDALATLTFDYPPRARFFRTQLRDYLKLDQVAGIDLYKVTGSYAGAMGYPQFIPSSYIHYAVDFDEDGKTDLLENPRDAIGSVANYFRQHGWQTGQPIASPARYLNTRRPESSLTPLVNQSLKPSHTVAFWIAQGLIPDISVDPQEPATAMKLNGENGIEYWIGLTNFYVITRYNHSHLYGMAVYQLSEALKQKM